MRDALPPEISLLADQGVKDEIIKNFDACAVEMEGAAIAQAAYLNNVPFLVVRAISDKADGSAEVDYPTFEALAVEHCVKMTLRILNRLRIDTARFSAEIAHYRLQGIDYYR